MAYNKRNDGRKFDELRPLKAEIGVIPKADGSAKFQIGKTIAIAAVYGPRSLHPKFLQDPTTGKLRCNYNMMSFSGSGDRVRPGPSRRSKEISLVIQNALEPVLDLKSFPGTVVDIFIEMIQTDAGTRCAGVTAAALALADAGFQMKDLVSAVAIGKIDGKIVVDVDKFEEDYACGMSDIPIAMMPRTGQVTLFQMDGYLKKEDIKEVISAAKKACNQIYKVQLDVLRERYKK